MHLIAAIQVKATRLTFNQSVIQVEDSQIKQPQYRQHAEIVDFGSEGADGDEDDATDDDDDENGEQEDGDDYDENDPKNYRMTQEESDFLERQGKAHLPIEDAVAFLAQARSEGFPTVDGDSYPTTTDGEPTEWRGEQGLTREPPSPRRSVVNGHRQMAQLSTPRQPQGGSNAQPLHSSTKLFKQSANIRDQQRDPIARSACDYDLEVLHKMSYDQLKNESFDSNPRAKDPPLSEDMLQKPLVERLEHVQKNFNPIKQSEFFHALPTREWEDAGDWFLEQFGSIINRTKEARKQKRKLAEGFEDEIEKRHKHVSMKCRQVGDAMSKMEAQGEGLVPRSPKPKRR
ncbi:hypothetical protein SNOG_12598 [Parastagonospora nodorum SN15]|uniref:Extracellular mutant protein 11 C-terminal domain-containing protein n=1 Tax=Phaeosphaeria nodorum (strain SN15 / ATCC MYA-4574 / FGSC 10173) TaxID=321614 RepID=Q0U6L6_PHANO|nr:hypothetical protein SNOG_12598 [Parastagonospora nodorum SN15]EAT79896.2 hypothetical protein SNOG_12598 [Parastagonospora nodorum SN15]